MLSSRPVNSSYMLEPNHIYFDFNMVNNDTTGEKPPPVLSFTETRNNPIVNNAEDYYISVVRFSVETPTLPVMIPQVELGQADPDQLIYTVNLTFELGGTLYESQTHLQFLPRNMYEPTPQPPLTKQDLTSEYYFIYNFQTFVEMLNIAFKDAMTDLNNQITAVGGALPSTNAPFMEFDPNSCQYILNGDVAGFNSEQPNTSSIYIWFNAPLYNLFSSLEARHYGYTGTTGGKNFQLICRDINNGNIYTPVPPSPSYYQSYGEYPTSPLWCPITSLVFQASLVPIIPEQQSQPLVFNSDVVFGEGGNNSAIGNVLTDLQVYLTKGNEYKPVVQYTPSAEYRLIDLQGQNPIKGIQVSCYWKDRFGGLHPFTLGSGCNASMKILFRKKTFPNLEKEYKE